MYLRNQFASGVMFICDCQQLILCSVPTNFINIKINAIIFLFYALIIF